MNACRLLLDNDRLGPDNMAIDEALLLSVAERGECSLRFYGWAEPTLSLGYFQRAADRDRHPSSQGCRMVRRQSGGGAIVHDVELTYSLTVPARHNLAADAARMYRETHAALMAVLSQWGIATELAHAAPTTRAGPEPFLCFHRRGPGDIVLKGTKVTGSAQRRRQGGILQHGSVLLESSRVARDLPGIKDLTGIQLERGKLARLWADEVGSRMRLDLREGALTEIESAQAARLAAEKYAADAWNLRR